MIYNLNTVNHDDHLTVSLSGNRCRETVFSAAHEVFSYCIKHSVDFLLVDARSFLGKLSPTDIISIGTVLFPKLRRRHLLKRVALLDTDHYKFYDHFFQSLRISRIYKFLMFTKYDKAVGWLLNSKV